MLIDKGWGVRFFSYFCKRKVKESFMLQRGKQISICFLLLVFTTYYVDITFFQHSHIINGVTIVHSHFHSNAHTQTESHSVNELTMISTLSDFQSAQVAILGVAIGLFVLVGTVMGVIPGDKVIVRPAFHPSLRAPPSVF
jgi:hypothetical protein